MILVTDDEIIVPEEYHSWKDRLQDSDDITVTADKSKDYYTMTYSGAEVIQMIQDFATKIGGDPQIQNIMRWHHDQRDPYWDAEDYVQMLTEVLDHIAEESKKEYTQRLKKIEQCIAEMYPSDWALWTDNRDHVWSIDQNVLEKSLWAYDRIQATPIGQIYVRQSLVKFTTSTADSLTIYNIEDCRDKLLALRKDYDDALSIYGLWRQNQAELTKQSADSNVYEYEL